MSEKIIWSEGMVLSPHHFQQADLLRDADMFARWQLVSPFFYGLSSLEIEGDALDNGFFSVRECSGIFPDGMHFGFPRQDAVLEQRPFETFFPAAKESLSVFVAMPAMALGSPNFSDTGLEGRPTRFIGQAREVGDSNTGLNVKEILFGRSNLRLIFEGEAKDGFQTLKLCELVRDAQGKVIQNEGFVPPCIRIAAARFAMTQLKKLTDLCIQKSNYLMGQRAQKASGVAQFSAESITNYLLLSAINSSLPELIHFHGHPSVHPEILFRKLLGFAGALLSFGNEAKVTDLPKYVHGDPQSGFTLLFRLLESLLGTTVPTGYKLFPLTKTSPVQYVGNMRDADFSRLGQFYLGVSAQASEVEIITTVQRKSKVGPVAKIEMMVNAALPGIGLIPETNPPQAIPAKAGFKYFRMQQSGDLWEQVVQGKALAIHMPSDLSATKLELVAIQD